MSVLGALSSLSGMNTSDDPYAEVKINGKVWKSKTAGISKVEVDMGVDGKISTCLVIIKGTQRDVSGKKININSDFSSIKIGVKLEVSLGYRNNATSVKNVEKVFVGYISDVCVELDYNGTINVTITGMDGRMWLIPSSVTKCFGEKKGYSDAIKDVYKDNSSKFSGMSVDTTPKLSFPIYIFEESYYDFCMRIAKITGYYFFVYLGKFNFVDLSKKTSVKKTIKPSKEVKRIRVTGSPFGIPKSVEVKGTDEKDLSKVVKSNVSSVTAIGSGKNASGLTSNVSSKMTVCDTAASSSSEAKKLAEAILKQRALNLVSTEIELAGDPSVQLATGLKLLGFGAPMDNSYIVTGIEHIFNFKNRKYITVVHLSANKYSPQGGGLGGAISGALGALSSLF